MNDQQPTPDALPLGPRHLEDLKKSGLTDDTIRAAGIRSVTEAEARRLLHRRDIRSGGYAIPYFEIEGNPILQKNGLPYVTVKLDHPPKDTKGKPKKYLKPGGEPNYPYFPPNQVTAIKDISLPLLVTEGEKKALEAAQEGFVCIALPGVWGFKTRKGNPEGQSIPLPQLDLIPMSNREIVIIFDSDRRTNPKVQQAERSFGECVRHRGGTTIVIQLPPPNYGGKTGLDDFLMAHSKFALQQLILEAKSQATEKPSRLNEGSAKPQILPADMADAYLQDLGLNPPNSGLYLHWYREEWFRFTGRIFVPYPTADLQANVVIYLRGTEARKKTTRTFINNVITHLQALCVLPSSVQLPARLFNNDWIYSQDFLVLSNCILNLEDLLNGSPNPILHPHSPSFFSLNELPFEFNPTASCPGWRSFVERVLPEPRSQLLLQEIFGYCLTYDTSLQKFFLFEGTGANGKGVALRILTKLLGEKNISSLPLERFHSSHELIVTLGKLVNITSDLGELDRVAEGLLKEFTGDDFMHFNPKYRTPFSTKPTAKLIIAANVRPPFRDRSEGIWRRLVILPFPVTIPAEERNPHLTDQLTTELPGILNWAIAGAFSLRHRGHFLETPKGIVARKEFQRESNPARLFLEESCEENPMSEVLTYSLYQAYTQFCLLRGYRPLNDTHFGREVHTVFPHVQKKKFPTQEDGTRPPGYYGIKILGSRLSY